MVHEAIHSCLPHDASYFAAANTAGGFHSRFSQVFSPGAFRKLYIIKGGPGTGKSYFMHTIADAATKAGKPVRYYYCSSDTKSLDGIVLPQDKIGILDGTAPHLTDPQYPGAVEEIVNMGQFFDSQKLARHRDTIAQFGAEKQLLYRRAYQYLSAARSVWQTQTELYRTAFLEEKATGAVIRLLRAIPQSTVFQQNEVFVTAIGTHGICHFETFERLADKHYYISKGTQAADLFFVQLLNALNAFGISHIRLPDCMVPTMTEGVYLPDTNTLFINRSDAILSETDRIINMDRFLDGKLLRRERDTLRAAHNMSLTLRAEAQNQLQRIAPLHEALEEIYINSMNFNKKERFTSAFLAALGF